MAKGGIQFRCSNCTQPLAARTSQAGMKKRCPSCQTMLVVPTVAEAAERVARATQTGEYTDRSVDPDAPPQTFITVICRLCHTRMYATEAEVGQEMVCPDCGTKTVVPPPQTPTEIDDPDEIAARRQDEYTVLGVEQPALTNREVYGVHIAVNCPVCHTRMLAGEDQVGREIVCPDCSQVVTVPPPPPPMEKPTYDIDPTDQYDVGQPIEPPKYESLLPKRGPTDEEDEWEEDDEREERPPLPPAPPGLFTRGLSGFLFETGVWPRWLSMSLGAMVVAFMVWVAVKGASGGAPTQVLAVVSGGLASVLALIWLVPSSAVLLAILQNAAGGAERIEDWPDGTFLDWVFDVFYVINSGAVAFIAGLCVAEIFPFVGAARYLFVAPVALLLFPILLLSLVEQGTPWNPISPNVWTSLYRGAGAWLRFFLLSGILVTCVVGGCILALYFVPLARYIVVPFLVAGMMVYFRLLGRLGWYVSGRAGE
jgi:DNA-directed RNA polymerase subunit RPC12/RpoP